MAVDLWVRDRMEVLGLRAMVSLRQHGPPRFRPEVEFLLSCAREHALDIPDDRGTLFAADALDWDTVVDLARRHRLQPFVCRCLPDDDSSIPSAVRTDLAHTADALVRRNLAMSSALVDVVDRLEEGGVRVLTYKGPSLAALAYRDITLRTFVDLDLLVPEADFDAAIELLCAGDYVVEDSFPTFGEKTLQAHDTGIVLDVHFRVTPTRYPFTFSFPQLWDRRVDVSLCGHTVPTFDPSDLIPVIAVHGTRHYWIQLEWLVSFAALSQHESITWDRVLRRAKQVGCDRMLRLGLQLSHELLGLSLPEEVSPLVTDDALVQRLAKRVISQVVCQDVPYAQRTRSFHYERYLTQLLLMRGVRAKGTYGLRIGTSLLTNRLSPRHFVVG